ncbi:MAG: hypothetical protein PHY08_03325 [Candidatus Cloacimonetes bacterium]|jgi:hypothetical protein|nr:hypothetical protein [Candidatus Cloacimonadota bacterium]MDD4155585.1 hypothetical protein [Candidatus Cloacimonadota bacterium]
MDNKKKAAAIAAIQTVIEEAQLEQNNTNAIQTELSAWTQYGKQAMMSNRNLMQMRVNHRK